METDIILTLALFTLIIASIIWPKIFKKKKPDYKEELKIEAIKRSEKEEFLTPKKLIEELFEQQIKN